MTAADEPGFRSVMPAMAAVFIDVLSYGLVIPLIISAFSLNTFIPDSPGLQPLLQGLALAMFPLGMFFGAATLGDLSDYWGRKKTLVLCMAGLAISFAAMALAIIIGSITLLILARLTSGLLGSSMAIGQATIIDLSTEETRALNLSRVTMINALAHFLGPGIGVLFGDIRLYLPFLLISFMAVLTMIWLTRSMTELRRSRSGLTIRWSKPVELFTEAFSAKNIRHLSTAYIFMHLGNSMSYQFFFIYLAEYCDFSTAGLNLYSALTMGGGAFAATFVFLPCLQKHCLPGTLSIACLLAAGSLSMLYAIEMPVAGRWLIGFLWASTMIIAYVNTLVLFSHCASEDRQGWVMGVAGSVFAFSCMLGGLTVSLLAWFTVGQVLVLSGLLLIVSAGLMLFQSP